MKFSLIISFCLICADFTAKGANISSAGLDGSQSGLLRINQTDEFWWFCIQPDGSPGPLSAGPTGYEANLVTLEYGWTRQTTDRFTFAAGAGELVQEDLPRQVNVVEYVLDNYLPWQSTTERFLEQKEASLGSTDLLGNTGFKTALNAVSAYVKLLHAKMYEDAAAFTSLSLYNPPNPFAEGVSTAETARRDMFATIVSDVNLQASGGLFTEYQPLHDYAVVHTFLSQADPADWQDLLIIGTVPEPSATLLAMGSMVLFFSRRRRLA